MFAFTALALEDGLNSIEVSWEWWRIPSRCEGREPGEREAAKDSPHTPPRRAFLPSGHFLLQLLYARLIIPDGLQLGGKHDQGENGKQQRLKNEQDEQNDRDCWGTRRASCRSMRNPTGAPFTVYASNKMVDRQEKCMAGDDCYVQSEEDEELLVVLAYAVVDPGTMVVHLANAPLAHTAVVSPLGLEAAALGTLVD